MWWLLSSFGCGTPSVGEACACALGHAARTCTHDGCGPCECLPSAQVDPDPVFTHEFYVRADGRGLEGTENEPWAEIRWKEVDEALGDGPVAVWFERGTRAPRPIEILRTDDGPNRVVIDGSTWGEGDRASAPGVTTTEVRRKRSRVTVRGFELSDTSAQGVFWEAGDGVVLEDLVVHDNRRSPGILFEYASRSGLPSTGITLRNNHVYNTHGECIYVGGVDGLGGTSHSDVTVERNLIHHCGLHARHGDDWDGINIKDGMRNVLLRDNVVFEAHWGYQLDSPVTVEGGLVHDVHDHGVMMGGQWGDGFDGTTIEDLAVIGTDEAGIYVGADEVDTRNLTIRRLTVERADRGIVFAGSVGVEGTVSDVLLTGSAAGMDGWGSVEVTMGPCATFGNGEADAGAAAGLARDCLRVAPGYRDLERLAGADGLYFTDDDGWRPTTGPALTAASDGGPLGAR